MTHHEECIFSVCDLASGCPCWCHKSVADTFLSNGITYHRAPYRVWRTVAILSVLLFLGTCLWAYVIVSKL